MALPRTTDKFTFRMMFVNVQYLRAIAALMVVFQHSQSVHRPAGVGVFGGLGVDLFFAISGFVIFATTLRDFSLREYLMKRCIRIIPIYWALTFVMAALILATPGLFSGTIFTFDHFIRSLLFIPTYTPSRVNEITPLLPPGWTLNYEMFFYASFGLLLVLFRNRLLLLVALTVLFGSLVVAGSFLKNDAAIAVTYTSSRLFEFLAGVFAAYLLLYWPRLPMRPVVAWTLMAGGWALLVHVGFFEGSVASLIAGIFAVVFAAAALDRAGTGGSYPFFKLLGDASYSIYLIHIFVLGALKQVLLRFAAASDSLIQTVMFISAAIVLSACAGVLMYLYFEVPVLGFLRWTLLKSRSGRLRTS